MNMKNKMITKVAKSMGIDINNPKIGLLINIKKQIKGLVSTNIMTKQEAILFLDNLKKEINEL